VREADALVHVLRCFADPEIVHVDGEVDPLRDVETIDTELILADLETAAKALPRLDKVVRTDPRSPQRLEFEVLERIKDSLQEGKTVRQLGLSPEQRTAVRGYNFLTQKPVLFVANVAEEDAGTGGDAIQGLAGILGTDRVLPIAAQIEAEIGQLPAGERQEFLADLGLERTGIDRLIVAGYHLLDLITFYTIAHEKLQAWQLPRNTLAPAAAGRIHSDMEEGFIRAEVARFDDLAACGSLARLRETGKLHTQGRDYAIQDGDVVQFLFRS